MSAHVDGALWEWARGELSAERSAEVAAHLEACPECAHKAEQAKAAQTLLAAVQVPRPTREFWERVDDKVLGSLPRPRKRTAWWSRLFETTGGRVAAMGALAVLVAIGASLLMQKPRPVELRWADAPAERVSATEWIDTGARLAVAALPEGSAVELAAGTRARFAQASAQNVRVEVEKGSVKVDATHREGRRFVVASGDVEVVVVGTRFLVAKEGTETVVEVFEGKVEVRRGQEVLAVSAGQKARVGDAELALVVTPRAQPAPEVEPEPPPVTSLTPPPPAPPAEVAKVDPPREKKERVAAVERHESVARLGGEEEEPEPVEVAPSARVDTTDAGAPVAMAPPAPKKTAKKRWPEAWATQLFKGDWKEWTNIDWVSDVVPPGVSEKEYGARQLVFLADDGRCDAVNTRAQRWLNRYAGEGMDEPTRAMARDVRFTWARCLEKLGKKEQADAVRAAAE